MLLFTRLDHYLDSWFNCLHIFFIFHQDSFTVQNMVSWAALRTTYTSQRVKAVYPGPWLLCFPTSVFPGVQQFCCRLQTIPLTWLQLLRQDSVQASRWPLSVPSVAVDFSIAPWQWCSWSAWHLPSWSEMWSLSLSLCKRGSPEHHRDTWKVDVVHHLAT